MFTSFPANIGATNNLLIGEMVDVSSSSKSTLSCTFLSGFTGSDHCRFQYGTDPTYMDLPYSVESNVTGTAGESVSMVLNEQLNSSTVYYYIVLAVVGDVTVRVLGTFTTPKYSKYYFSMIIMYLRASYLSPHPRNSRN